MAISLPSVVAGDASVSGCYYFRLARDTIAALLRFLKEDMTRPTMLVIAASLMLAPAAAVFASTATAAATLPASNPLRKRAAAIQLSAVDKVQDADYAPAFTAGMAVNLRNQCDANNKNLHVRQHHRGMERSGQLLSVYHRVFRDVRLEYE